MDFRYALCHTPAGSRPFSLIRPSLRISSGCVTQVKPLPSRTIITRNRHSGSLRCHALIPSRIACSCHAVTSIDFPFSGVAAKEVRAATGQRMDYDLLMLVPPFEGPGEAISTGITDPNG